MVKIAVIGGSGVYNPDMLENVRKETVETPYGDVSLQIGTYAGKEIAFWHVMAVIILLPHTRLIIVPISMPLKS